MHWISLPLQSGHGVLMVIFAVVLLAPRLGRLLKLPDLVGLVIGGVVVGPHVLGVIERAGTIAALGTAGLLYLMFQAGLELDPDDFRAQRRAAAVFGTLTFALPFSLGVIVHWALGFGALAALLLGSCWASHTLLTYPMFQHARATSNRAVSIGVAGTIVTDTAALLVLVVLARAHEGDLDPTALALQLPVLAAAGVTVLAGLPRLAAWFFAGVGRERPARFLFVMVALYGSSLLAETVGVEPIIGAFFAGLALNRLVVEGSELDDTIRQFGSALLVPIFLVSVGMLIDPAGAVTDGRTLVLAASFSSVVVVGKWLAAAATARIHRFEPGERLTLVALSVPQAAATLAAVFVGFDIGLLEAATVDAVVIVILVTCLLGTIVANRAIRRLPPAPSRSTPIGRRIIVPTSTSAASAAAVELAAALGRKDSGTVYPLSVLDLGATHAEVNALRRHMIATAEQVVLANRCEAHSIVRLDLTPAAGLMHAAIETDATMVVLPWDGSRATRHDRFGPAADTLLDLANTPVIIARTEELRRYRRVVLRLDAHDLLAARRPLAELGWLVGTRLADHLKVPLVLATAVGPETLAAVSAISGHVDRIEHLEESGGAEVRRAGDLVIRTLDGPGDDRSTLWVAMPRAANLDARAPSPS